MCENLPRRIRFPSIVWLNDGDRRVGSTLPPRERSPSRAGDIERPILGTRLPLRNTVLNASRQWHGGGIRGERGWNPPASAQAPRKRGGRFSRKARTPSL